MENLKVRVEEMDHSAGYYDPVSHTITLNDPSYLDYLARKNNNPQLSPKSVLLHEVQHAIQHIEKLPAGDSVTNHMDSLELERASLEQRWDNLSFQKARAIEKGDKVSAEKLGRIMDLINKRLMGEFSPETLRNKAMDLYIRSAGEQQATNVQARIAMTPEERAASFPPSTMTAPLEEQLVRYNDTQPSFAELPLS